MEDHETSFRIIVELHKLLPNASAIRLGIRPNPTKCFPDHWFKFLKRHRFAVGIHRVLSIFIDKFFGPSLAGIFSPLFPCESVINGRMIVAIVLLQFTVMRERPIILLRNVGAKYLRCKFTISYRNDQKSNVIKQSGNRRLGIKSIPMHLGSSLQTVTAGINRITKYRESCSMTLDSHSACSAG